MLAALVEEVVVLKDASSQFVSESCFKTAGGEGFDGHKGVGGCVDDGKGANDRAVVGKMVALECRVVSKGYSNGMGPSEAFEA